MRIRCLMLQVRGMKKIILFMLAFSVLALVSFLITCAILDTEKEKSTSKELQVSALTGTGTSVDPYKIYSQADLAAITPIMIDNKGALHYKLMNDIEINLASFEPVGWWGGYNYAIEGVFDGNWNKITYKGE